MTELNINDYKKILDYYNKPIPNSRRLIKEKAENLLAKKLCRCIKKVDKINEARAIGICTKTVVNRKGYTRGSFKCIGKEKITLRKNKSKKNKTSKNKN
jgi:hypothetical protein